MYFFSFPPCSFLEFLAKKWRWGDSVNRLYLLFLTHTPPSFFPDISWSFTDIKMPKCPCSPMPTAFLRSTSFPPLSTVVFIICLILMGLMLLEASNKHILNKMFLINPASLYYQLDFSWLDWENPLHLWWNGFWLNLDSHHPPFPLPLFLPLSWMALRKMLKCH